MSYIRRTTHETRSKRWWGARGREQKAVPRAAVLRDCEPRHAGGHTPYSAPLSAVRENGRCLVIFLQTGLGYVPGTVRGSAETLVKKTWPRLPRRLQTSRKAQTRNTLPPFYQPEFGSGGVRGQNEFRWNITLFLKRTGILPCLNLVLDEGPGLAGTSAPVIICIPGLMSDSGKARPALANRSRIGEK